MTRKEIKDHVIEIVSNKIGLDQNEICESTRFIEDLGTDSLDVVELLMEFERVFGIMIKDEEMMSVGTVGEVIDAICKKLDVPICKQQPEVDLEKEIVSICETYGITKYLDAELGPHDIKNIARHFYELGLNARKED